MFQQIVNALGFDSSDLVLVLLGVFFLAYFLLEYVKKSSKKTNIPGMEPRTRATGNLLDIQDAGNLHNFMVKLHKDFGPIASFWYGDEQVVSIASPLLWKDIQGVFNRPYSVFKIFEPILTKHAIPFANDEEGKRRHKLISSSFSHQALKKYYGQFTSAAEELAEKWEKVGAEEHVNLQETFNTMSVQAIMQYAAGPYFKDEKTMKKYRDSLYICWLEMQRRVDGVVPEEGSERDLKIKAHVANLKEITTGAIEAGRHLKVPDEENNLLNAMLHAGYTDEIIYGDMIATLVGAFGETGLLMIWSLYLMSKYPQIQEKVYQEMKQVLREEPVTPESVSKLTFTKQVLDETVRFTALATYAGRVSDVDLKVGEYIVPKQTPFFLAFGVVHYDSTLWTEPQRFDPDRFDRNEMKKKPPLTYSPFGFGKRQCPGFRFAYAQVTVALAILLRRFKFHLVEGQEIQRVYSLTTHPDKDIFVTLSKR